MSGILQPIKIATPGHTNIGTRPGQDLNRDGIPESLQGRVVQGQRHVHITPRTVPSAGLPGMRSVGVPLPVNVVLPQAPLVQEAPVTAEPPQTMCLEPPRTAIPPMPSQPQAPGVALTEADTQSICNLVMMNIGTQFDEIFAKLEEHIDELYKRVTPEQIIILSERLAAVETGVKQVKPSGGMEVTILQEEFRNGIREVRHMSEQMQFMPAKFEQIDKAILDLEQNQWPMKDMEKLGLLSHRVSDLEEKDQSNQRATTREHNFAMKWSEAKISELERKMAMKPDTVISQDLVDQLYERVTELEQKLRREPEQASSSSRERSSLELQELVDQRLQAHLSERRASGLFVERSSLELQELVDQRLQAHFSERAASGLSMKSQADAGQDKQCFSNDVDFALLRSTVEQHQGELKYLRVALERHGINSSEEIGRLVSSHAQHQEQLTNLSNALERVGSKASTDEEIARLHSADLQRQAEMTNLRNSLERLSTRARQSHAATDPNRQSPAATEYRLEDLENDFKERMQLVDSQLEGLQHTLNEKQQFLSVLDQRLYEVMTKQTDAQEVTKMQLDLKDALDMLKHDHEEAHRGHARSHIELHNKLARESANCHKMMSLHRDDILNFVAQKQVWILTVKICCAYELKNSSYYCEVRICRNGVKRHTKVASGVNPEWDEEFSIADYVPGDPLLFTVFESSTFQKTVVGKVELLGDSIRKSGTFKGDLPLEDLREQGGRQPRLTVQASERLRSE